MDPAGIFRAPQAIRGRSRLPLIAGTCVFAGFAIGFGAVRLGLPGSREAPALLEEPAPAAAPPRPELAPPAPAPAVPAAPTPKTAAAGSRPAGSAKRAARGAPAAPRPGGSGVLDVAAPADAEVFLDGKRIGRGSVKMEVAEGPHRIEVRRGAERVEEGFTVAPGETWTYEVSPAP